MVFLLPGVWEIGFSLSLLLRMEDLTRSWSCLTLSECEGSNLRISEEQAATEYILAAKFLTKRALNIDAIAKMFTPLWKSVNLKSKRRAIMWF